MQQDGWSKMELIRCDRYHSSGSGKISARLASPILHAFELQAALRIRDVTRYTAKLPGDEFIGKDRSAEHSKELSPISVDKRATRTGSSSKAAQRYSSHLGL